MYYLRSALDWHNPEVQAKLGWADVLLFQRNVIGPEIWDAMSYWKALRKIVLVDLDDGYSCIPASNPAFPHWILNTPGLDPDPVPALEEGLRHADALIAPNRVLLQDWAHVVAGYYWQNFPSILDYQDLQPRDIANPDYLFSYPDAPELKKLNPDEPPPLLQNERPGSKGRLVIGWGGSISHVDSFVYSHVVEALARILKEFPHVDFKFCGNDDRLDFLWKELPKDQFIRQNGVLPRKDWPQVVSQFSIGIAPMDMRPVEGKTASQVNNYSYDERRSSLKLTEYLCAGVPFVATRCHPYEELGHLGKLVENTPDAWYNALRERILGYDHFKTEAMKNRQWALKKLTIENNAERLIRLYAKIGEEAQARTGLRVPNTTFVNPEVATEIDETLHVEELDPPFWSGHPHEVGRAPYDVKAKKGARDVAREPWMTAADLEIGSILEYPLTAKLNQIYREHERRTEEAIVADDGRAIADQPLETT